MKLLDLIRSSLACAWYAALIHVLNTKPGVTVNANNMLHKERMIVVLERSCDRMQDWLSEPILHSQSRISSDPGTDITKAVGTLLIALECDPGSTSRTHCSLLLHLERRSEK